MSRSIIPMHNGSTVLSATLETEVRGEWQFGTVLAFQEDNPLHPYVVWSVERHELNDDTWVALHGEYHQNLPDAEAAYVRRTSPNA